MAIKSGIFNSVNGDRRYKAEDFASYFAMFIGNGVFPNPSNGFQVIANSDMTVSLKAGNAWIFGYYATNDDDYTMVLDVADGVLNRIDRVVLQLNYLNRSIVPLIKKGTFASSPVAPVLKRDADAYEIALADIRINKGVLSITQSNITDTRLNKDLCGIVHGTVDQVDTTTIFNQYQTWFAEIQSSTSSELDDFKTINEQEFNIWFEGIINILSGDVATNLANQIQNLKQDFTTHKAKKASLTEEGHVQLSDNANTESDTLAATPNAVRKKVEQTDYKITKSSKDSEGIFTTVEYKRKADNTLAIKAVLSGGTTPKYTKRTITYYALNGVTVEKTDIFTLSYDAEGDLISEV